MISFLRDIIEAITYIPQYILWAIETLFNSLMLAVLGIFTIASALIPLPSEPAPPELITSINWYFPVGAVISIMTPVLTGYIAFLAVRWIFSKVGEL